VRHDHQARDGARWLDPSEMKDFNSTVGLFLAMRRCSWGKGERVHLASRQDGPDGSSRYVHPAGSVAGHADPARMAADGIEHQK
jgi:hypothetical protein